MAIKDLGKIGGFVRHYAGELTGIAAALRGVVGALPIDRADKDRISGIIAGLERGAEAASAGAGALMDDVRKVVVKRSDVEAAVAAYLESPKGAAALAKAVQGASK